MDENIRTILSVTIPALVAIIGFIVTYVLNKRNFHEELRKQKTNIQLEKFADVPYDILMLFTAIVDGMKNEKVIVKNFNSLMVKIFVYGSKEAISIAADMQEFNFTNAASLTKQEPPVDYLAKLMAYYILLLCQIKYDLTETMINPEYWYRIKFKDYSTTKEQYSKSVNEIVGKLNLQPFLRIR